MALAILDGTQTATTLSTILSSGQHITAHTVVSLGTQAITDIVNATSAGLTNTQLRASAVTVGGTVTVGNSLTISSLPAISGTVTVGNISTQSDSAGNKVVRTFVFGYDYNTQVPRAVAIDNNSLSITGAINSLADGDGSVFGLDRNFPVDIYSALPAGTAQIGSVTASISNFPATQAISISSVTVGNSVTIGSLPAISGTVTANLSISSTAITSGSFASLTSATLVPGNVARKMATVYNLGPGQLFINAGATATTLGGGFMVALSSSDYLECGFTTTTLSALFATAGTASWVSH